jgi:hypothetical protein
VWKDRGTCRTLDPRGRSELVSFVGAPINRSTLLFRSSSLIIATGLLIRLGRVAPKQAGYWPYSGRFALAGTFIRYRNSIRRTSASQTKSS